MKPVVLINDYRKVDKLLLVDRDGTLIKDLRNRSYLNHQDIYLSQLNLISGVQKIALKGDTSFGVVIITNQSVIGRGVINFDSFTKIMLVLEKYFLDLDITFLGIVCCPHTAEDGCECRKPNALMIHRANYIWASSSCSKVFWGNTKTDYGAGMNAKVPTILTMEVNEMDRQKFGKSQGELLIEKTREYFEL